MNLNDILNIIQSYSHVDIESNGKIIRKHLPTGELSINLLGSYLSIHDTLSVIPKRMMGNAPMKQQDEAIIISKDSIKGSGLSGVENVARPTVGGESELYRILYENAKEEAREYKRKYEDAQADKHKAEIEIAGNRNGGLGDIIQGLAGFAPVFMGSGASQGAVPLGDANQPTPTIKVDARLQNITKRFVTLAEEDKDSIYGLTIKAFANLDKIDDIISML